MATLNSTAAITPAVAIIRGSSQSGVPMDCRRGRVCVEGCTKNLPRCNWVGVPLDAELVELILSWHELPEETKILVSRHFHDL